MKKIILLFSGLAFAASMVSAQVISLNLIPSGDGDFNTSVADLDLDPVDVAGVVPAANWNNVRSSGRNYDDFTQGDLVDGTGAVVPGAEFAWASSGDGGGFKIDGDITSTPDRKMMGSALGTWEGNNTVTYTVTGLSADFTGPGYFVYAYWGGQSVDFGAPEDEIIDLYTMSGTGESFVMGYTGQTVEGTSYWDGDFSQSMITSLDDFDNPGDFGAYNYIVFSGLTADNFTITVEQGEERRHGQISGLQIVAIPEPGAYAAIFGLAALGILVLLRRRR